jgi:putative DNA-binding protein
MRPLDPIASPYAAFASALLDPERTTPAALVGPAGKMAGKRYDVYRNNVTASLIEALAAIYPAVQRITGAEFFRAMARFHVRATPPTSPLLFEYGREFPAFIETYEYAQGMPWLADVARIERAWLDAYHAADAAILSAEALAAIPSVQLASAVFAPHSATRVVRSHFSAVTIFAANRAEGAVNHIDAGTAEDALITRPDMEVVVRHLPEGGAVFLTSLMSGCSLGEAAASALQTSPDFDISANIAGMIEAGAFTTINLGVRRCLLIEKSPRLNDCGRLLSLPPRPAS